MVKLWIKDEISKIRKHIYNDQEHEETGLAKIDILEKFYETFELDKVNAKITYHAKI